MAFKEVNFKISSVKEKQLFEYITEICNCKILNPVVDDLNKAIYSVDLPIDSPLYIIKGNSFTPQYKWANTEYKGEQYVLEFSSSRFDYVYISYDREIYSTNGEPINRLFIFVDYFTKLENESLNNFNRIQKWIKNNAQKIEKMDNIRVYCVG